MGGRRRRAQAGYCSGIQSQGANLVKQKLGENIAREWAEEPAAPELWGALQKIKLDPLAGRELLESLAQRGSALGMMYLGQRYSTGRNGFSQDPKLAEYWLRRSAETSIEGAFQLAIHLRRAGRREEELMEFRKLVDLKYSPAMFQLGCAYYYGSAVKKDLEKALYYFDLGEKEGHLPAAQWSGNTLIRMGSISALRGVLKKLWFLVPILKQFAIYPDSDRIRL